ncbi:MAG: GFA family protein [Pseudomonadota bacterium]
MSEAVTEATDREPLARPIHGKCLCGTVSLTLHRARPMVDMCHCTMCQTWGGGPFAGLSGASFDISGEEHVSIYRSSNWAERAFCSTCGSNLWYRFIPGDHTSFVAGLFDLPDDIGVLQQIFVDEQPNWYKFIADSPKKTGAEVMAEAKAAGFTFE